MNKYRLILFMSIIIINILFYDAIITIQKQENCTCKSGWKVENIKLLSFLNIIISILNIIIPINNILYNIPVIGTIITFSVVIITFGLLFMLIQYSRELNSGDCKDNCNSNILIFNIFKNISINVAFIISIVISVLMFYNY